MADTKFLIWMVLTMMVECQNKIINVTRTFGTHIIDTYVEDGKLHKCEENTSAILRTRTMQCDRDKKLDAADCKYIKNYESISYQYNCSITYFKRKKEPNLYDGDFDYQPVYKPSFNGGNFQFSNKDIENNHLGYIWELRFNCTDHNARNVTEHCLTFTTPKIVLQRITTTSSAISLTTTKENEKTSDFNATTTSATSTVHHNRSFINQSTANTHQNSNLSTLTTKSTSSHTTTGVIKKFISSTAVPNSTTTPLADKGKKKSSNVIIYLIVAGCLGLLLLMALIFIFCCRKRRRSANKDTLINMAPLQHDDDDVFPGSPNVDDLHSKPKKRKRCPCFKPKQTKQPVVDWPGYEKVGSVIKGTYEARESTSAGDFDTRCGVSALYLKNAEGDRTLENEATPLVQEDPYEIIGRTNSFTPGRLKKNGEKNSNPASGSLKLMETRLSPPEHEDEPSEMSLKTIEGIEGDALNSTFKPGGSIRIKQQRTSMRKNQNKESITHENVRITPPVSKRTSLNTSMASLQEKSDGIASESDSQTEQPLSETVNDNSSDSLEKDTNSKKDPTESDDVTKSNNERQDYEEIWVGSDTTRHDTTQKTPPTVDGNNTENHVKTGETVTPQYTPVIIIPNSDSDVQSSNMKPEKTNYIDVDIH